MGQTMAETPFAKISARQIPARIAYEDEQYIAIHDISPQAPVHVLVIPKKVIPTLNDVEEGDRLLVGGMFKVAAKLMGELGHSDYRTVFNCGAGAQQTVFHLHLHVLAGRPFSWPPGGGKRRHLAGECATSLSSFENLGRRRNRLRGVRGSIR